MYSSNHDCISCAEKYINLGWWLVPIRGNGSAPKAPLLDGWPEWKPDNESLVEVLQKHPAAGIGVHLGGSGLLDLEGDSDAGEAILTNLCRGMDFPCWRSTRSTHRLFQVHPDVSHLNIKALAIEFRTGRNQSVLPPTAFQDGARYEWLVNPFDVSPPPLPDHLVDFYREYAEATDPIERTTAPTGKDTRFPFRDDLDYLLRHFDLLVEGENAGLDLLCHHPDVNGNIPCFVPAILRNGKPDHHPSGIFNVYNGVLHDFATGLNHRYFRLLEALTGEPWLNIFRQYEEKAGPVSGRPHSRRISLPRPTHAAEEKVDLQSARQRLGQYLDEQLSRPPQPKTLHLIKGPCGVGKTYSLCKLLANRDTKAIILTLENELAGNHLQIINEEPGGNARRMPVLNESPCPHQKEYEATTRRGYKPSQSYPCQRCRIGPEHCPYLLGFQDVTTAAQLCCAAIYHTHDDFYVNHGNENRHVLIFDESCVDLILAPHTNPIREWSAWGRLIQNWAKTDLQRAHANHLIAMVAWLEGIANAFQQTDDKFRPYAVPDELAVPSLEASPSLQRWLNRAGTDKRNHHIPNLYSSAIYLLTEPGVAILLERIGDNIIVRFRRKHPLPENKEIYILDATANEELIRALAPGWDVRVWECPPIEQKGSVIQIMDYDISRNRIRKEVARHREGNPSWLVQVLDGILEKEGAAPIISFKQVTNEPTPENDILGLLNYDVIDSDNYPCRGYTLDSRTLIVMGTPYKDEATIWELALAIHGMEGLPESIYHRRWQENGDFVAGIMAYQEDSLAPIVDFIVSADLAQAVGRIRPLQNECTAYVISNAPIHDWEVQQFCASELFDLRNPLRKDANDNYQEYIETLDSLMDQQEWIKNSDVCASMGIPERTGSNYWKRYKDDHKDTIIVDGPRITRRQSE